jgi:small-conductance mechanosensitive channel
VNIALGKTPKAVWLWFSGAPLHVLTIIVIAFAIAWLGSRAIGRIVTRIASGSGAHRNTHHETNIRLRERALTTGSVLRSTLNAAVLLVATVMVLGELGLNVAPIVASASVIGLAVGLGAQSIVKDMVSGLFLLLEDQFGVGDKITANDISGIVESVGLRVTTLRDESNVLWYVRNGDIVKVGNSSQAK